jgi:hypothetical protein
MIAILTWVRRNCNVVLIYISLMAKNGKHFSCIHCPFVFLLRTICSNHLSFIGWIICSFYYLFFWYFIFWVPYIFWILILCQVNTKIFSCLFTLVILFFAVQKILNLMQSHLSILLFFPELLESYSESLRQCLTMFPLCFSLVVSKFCLIVKSLLHF